MQKNGMLDVAGVARDAGIFSRRLTFSLISAFRQVAFRILYHIWWVCVGKSALYSETFVFFEQRKRYAWFRPSSRCFFLVRPSETMRWDSRR